MADHYPITTAELVSVGLKEIGKTLPVLGSIVNAHEKVFEKIEANRVRLVLEDFAKRLEAVEKQAGKPTVLDSHAAAAVFHGCDQARGDPAVETKAPYYGGAMCHYIGKQASPDEVAEVMEMLRRLNVIDLKLLYSLKSGHKYFPNRRVDEMLGYAAHLQSFQEKSVLAQRMAAALPSFKRLEALGVVYLSHENVGGIVHDIGSLSTYMTMWAHLTPAGINLVRALPI